MNRKIIFILLCLVAFVASCSSRQPGRLQIINHTDADFYYKVIFELDDQKLARPAENPVLSKLGKGESVTWGLDMRKYARGRLYIKLFKIDTVTSAIQFIRDEVVSIPSLPGDSAKPIIIDKL